MDHSDMDHSGMDHGGMDMGAKCNMNMLFTWDTTNLCIIFRWWHISSTMTLLVSLVAVALLTAGYEAVREASRKYEARSAEYANTLPNDGGDDDAGRDRGSFLWSGKGAGQREKKVRLVKAAFYAVQVFYSFFIMLLFMTYNGWVMFAVAVGASVGYIGFGNSSSTKSVACH
ncbi:hypothetical protein IMSHALPRED_006936 [Imshaugia aleurites]|uniref:Copper transport protein n=1 Tax=Imshaugia aleurites TaxID=172621 RepID=A0A8H3FKP6_9LECA|nr:hypothetical protein IMSHALPRED_006936 [Imshaugia aleurites]